MNLSDLRAKGAFVPNELVKRTVEWTSPDGESVSFDVYVKRLAYGDFERIVLDGEDERCKGAGIIAATIHFDEAGKEPFPYKDAYQLEKSLASVLLEASNGINRAERPKG